MIGRVGRGQYPGIVRTQDLLKTGREIVHPGTGIPGKFQGIETAVQETGTRVTIIRGITTLVTETTGTGEIPGQVTGTLGTVAPGTEIPGIPETEVIAGTEAGIVPGIVGEIVMTDRELGAQMTGIAGIKADLTIVQSAVTPETGTTGGITVHVGTIVRVGTVPTGTTEMEHEEEKVVTTAGTAEKANLNLE
jgi:hypothetical protein